MPSIRVAVAAHRRVHSLCREMQAQASMADRMRRLLSPFILRRLKSEVAGQLVPKVHLLQEVSCLLVCAHTFLCCVCLCMCARA